MGWETNAGFSAMAGLQFRRDRQGISPTSGAGTSRRRPAPGHRHRHERHAARSQSSKFLGDGNDSVRI